MNPFRTRRAGFAVRVLGTLLLALGAAMLCVRLHTPIPWMLGPLLVTAVALLAAMQFSMLSMPWLQLKLVLLVAYVALGVFALKRAPTRSGKALAFAAALLCFAHMYGMARTKDILGWFA